MSKHKLISLPQYWLDEIERLTLQPTTKQLMMQLIGTLHICEVVLDRLRSRKRYISKADTLEKISYYFFAHSYHLGYSIYHLVKLGYISAALILTRSVLETLIDFSYLWLCKEINGNDTDEREAWMWYETVTRKSLENRWNQMQSYRTKNKLPVIEPLTIFNHDLSDEINRQKKEFDERFRRKHWALLEALDQRARAVDKIQKLEIIDLEKTYILSYKWTSELVHGASASANTYLSYDIENGLNVDFGPTGKNIDIAINMCAHFLSVFLHIINHINHLGIDIRKQYEYLKLNDKSGSE